MNTRMAAAALALLTALAGATEAPAQVVLEAGQWIDGVLDSTDVRDREGSLYDSFHLPSEFQGLARITLESGDFDTLVLWGVMGGGRFLEVDGNDDADGLAHETDSRLYAVVFPEERAQIRVSSWMGEGTGRYRIRWDPVPTPVADVQTLSFGADVRGVLEEGDPFVDGSFEDRFRFRGQAGEVVSVMLQSTEFDVFLEVWDPSGQMLASDDDGLGVTDAWVEVELPESGEYELRVRSYMVAFGEYRLRLSVS